MNEPKQPLPTNPSPSMERILPPMIWGRVHFVYGGKHIPAIICDPHYSPGPDMPNMQALVIFPINNPPFTTVATCDPEGADATWHWPEPGEEPA